MLDLTKKLTSVESCAVCIEILGHVVYVWNGAVFRDQRCPLAPNRLLLPTFYQSSHPRKKNISLPNLKKTRNQRFGHFGHRPKMNTGLTWNCHYDNLTSRIQPLRLAHMPQLNYREVNSVPVLRYQFMNAYPTVPLLFRSRPPNRG